MTTRSYFGQGARAIAIVRSDTGDDGFLKRAWIFASFCLLLFALMGGARVAHAAGGPVAPRLLTAAEQATAEVGDRIGAAFEVMAATPMRVFTPPAKMAAIDMDEEASSVPRLASVKETSVKEASAPRRNVPHRAVAPRKPLPAPVQEVNIFCAWFGIFCPVVQEAPKVVVMPPPTPDHGDAFVANGKTLAVERGLVDPKVYFSEPARKRKRAK